MKIFVNIKAQYVGEHCMHYGLNEVPKELQKEVADLHKQFPKNFDVLEEEKSFEKESKEDYNEAEEVAEKKVTEKSKTKKTRKKAKK